MVKSTNKSSKPSEFGIDRLSNLPDDLLSIILSFLTTENAVASSVLSTRWKSVWTSLTNLNFDGPALSSKRRFHQLTMKQIDFAKFVNRVSRQITPQRIQIFRLHYTQHLFHPAPLKWWITEIAPTVRELDLSISINDDWYGKSMELEMIHFYFNKLEVLKLIGDIDFKIPAKASVCFPNLRTLHLLKVTFSVANDSSFSFPNLKVLQFHDARIMDAYSVNKLFSSCPILDHLDIHIGHISYNNIHGLVLPSLTSLTLDLLGSYGRLCQMQLDKLSELKFLSTSYDSLWYITRVSRRLSWRFGNLKRLELEVNVCSQFSVGMRNMLESIVNLEHLVVKKWKYHCSCASSPYPSHMSWWREPLTVPECLLSHLTTLTITPAMDSCTNEVELVRYFLMNAKVLQLLRLDTKSYSPKRKLILIEKLSMFPKGSQACQVELTSKRTPHFLIGSRV